MRPQKPIKIKRGRDRTQWVIPVLSLAVTMTASLGIALVWQHMSADAIEPQGFIPNSARVEVLPSEPPASSQVVEEPPAPEETKPVMMSDFYGMVFPESDRVTSEYFDDAVFIGDSITTGITIYDAMNNADVFAATGLNLSSINTAGVVDAADGSKITVLDALSRGDYKKIYIMIGANGIGYLTNEQTVELYGKFIDSIKSIKPDSIIYIQSILPINEQKYQRQYKAVMTNADIDYINQELIKIAGEKNCFYLDVASAFKDENGIMSDASTPDGLHLYSAGYTTWFDYLKTHAYDQKEV